MKCTETSLITNIMIRTIISSAKMAVGTLMLLLAIVSSVHSQTLMPLPPHSSVYDNIYARGYWFLAPMNFTITGLMVAPEAGTGLQYIHVMKCTGVFPIGASAPGSPLFTTLTYISGATNNVVQPVNISVQQGDQIGILGTVTGICNSYAASAIVTSSIGGQSVYLNRFGYQGSIETGPAPGYWGVGNGTSGQIGRIYMYYSTASRTDAGIDSLVFPGDSVCAGTQPVQVKLKNWGPQPLVSAEIHWSVNNQTQTAYSWSGNVPINGTDTVTVGTYLFSSGIPYAIKAYTSTPNTYSDTANFNDTLVKSGIFIKAAPGFILTDTLKAICQGDSVFLAGTLSGLPPWDLIIQDGMTNIPVTQITNPAFSYLLTPSITKTYTVTQISDASGCENTEEYNFTVSVNPAPPAVITPMSSTAACEGDSVVLMASIGLNFTYEWFLNGTVIPNQTNYVLVCKQAGAYTVKITSPIGCSNLSAPTNVFFHPVPVINLGKDTALLPNQNILLDAGAGFTAYNWSTGAGTPTIWIDTAGFGLGVRTIWVEVTDNFGCHGRDTININFTQHPGMADPDNAAEQVYLYPNPSGGRMDVLLSNFPAGPVDLEIYGQHGRRVLHEQHLITSARSTIALDLSNLAEGIYLVRINTAQTSHTQKLILRR